MPYLVDPVVDPTRLAGPQPEISGRGLILRRWTAGDSRMLVTAFGDEAIRRWNLRSLDSTEEAAKLVASWKQGWKRHVSASWAVVAEDSPSSVFGQVGFRTLYPDDGMAEVSYWVVPRYRRRGIATRATRVLSDWAVDELGLVRLELVHSTLNPVSCSVATAAGFEYEGVKRRLQRHLDGWHDMCLHARIANTQAPIRVSIPLRLRAAARLDRPHRAGEAAGRPREMAVARR